jgi:hypothetical protein
MRSVGTSFKAERLTPAEQAFLGASVLIWTAYTVWLGKDTSWDFRNYHWYIPYALLNGRLDVDIAVAHQGSYYNPLSDVPFYLLARYTTSWFAVAILGLIQALNIVPMYLMARSCLKIAERELAAAAVSFFGMTGGMMLTLYGTHYYDNALSLFTLTGLAIVVIRRQEMAEGALVSVGKWCALAGFLTGFAAGLKLPMAPYAMGFAAALIAVGGSRKHILTRLVAGGIGGVAGFFAGAGYWMLRMQELTGNPLFPYFNDYFRSPMALASPYRDMRFIQHGLWNNFTFPIRFSIDSRVADDLPYGDIRIGIAYLVVLAGTAVWLLGKRNKEPLCDPLATRILFVFAAVTYLFWLKLFAIHRYILQLEMLMPLLVAMGIGLMPIGRKIRLVTIGILFFAALLFTHDGRRYLEGAPLGDPYIAVDLPKIAEPAKTMVVMTGDAPLGFIASSLPPEIPVLRIDGWMMQPEDGSYLTGEMRRRVAAHQGPLFLIADAYDMGRASAAVVDYGLAIDWQKCRIFTTNLTGAYQWCPLQHRN